MSAKSTGISSCLIFTMICFTPQSAADYLSTYKHALSPLKNCWLVLHDHWSKSPLNFSLVASSFLDGDTPAILSSGQYKSRSGKVAEEIRGNLSHCVFHAIILPADGAVSKMASVIKKFSSQISEYEYYLVLPVYDNDSASPTYFGQEFSGKRASISKLLYYVQNWAILPIQYGAHVEGVSTTASMKFVGLYCSDNSTVCLSTPGNIDVRQIEDSTDEERAILEFNAIFPRSSTATRANYHLYPINVMQTHVNKKEKNTTYLQSVPWRELFSINCPADQRGKPLVRVFSEVAGFLNATLKFGTKLMDDERERQPVPTSTIGFQIMDKYYPVIETLAMSTDRLTFLYCVNVTRLNAGGTEQQLLVPFHWTVWLPIGIAVISICAVFKVSIGKTYVFDVLTNLLMQGNIVVGGKTGGALSILWVFTCIILVNFYTSLIESILIAPLGRQMIHTFDQLGEAGYRIVLPRNNSIARNNLSYWRQMLPAGVDVTQSLGEYTTFSFMARLFRRKREATVLVGTAAQTYADVLTENLPGMKCYQGDERFGSRVLGYRTWLNLSPNKLLVHSVFRRLHVSGVLKLFMDVYIPKENNEWVEGPRKAFESQCGINRYNGPACQNNKGDGPEFKTDFSQAKVILIVWILGLGVGFGIFAGEHLYKIVIRRFSIRKGRVAGHVKQGWFLD